MRTSLALCLLLASAGLAMAQNQERKLVDRLLRPDMTLQSSEQKKKFAADGKSVHKSASVGAFYVHREPKTKDFSQARDFSTRKWDSRSYAGGDKAHYSPEKWTTNSQRTYSTSRAPAFKSAHDSNKTTKGHDFSGNRPFLSQGKSQKALDQKKAPMTIEQVRELLNKN